MTTPPSPGFPLPVPSPGYRIRLLDGRTFERPPGADDDPTPPGADVRVAIAFDPLPSGGRRYRIEVEADAPLLEVVFPVLALPAGDDLVVALQGGARVTDLARAVEGAGGLLRLAYPGPLTMQFWQYGPVYVATDDTLGLTRRWEFRTGPDGALEAALVQPTEAVTRYEGPYGCRIEPALADAFAAASHYRAWALDQPWCARGPLAARAAAGDLPGWLFDTDLWLWNRGNGAALAENAQALRDAIGGPVSALWYWWHGAAYDDGFPDYLPPREGWPAFEATLGALHAQGTPVSVYVNGRLCGERSAAYARPEIRAARAQPFGAPPPVEVYNRFTDAPMAVMCPADAGWRSVLSDTVLSLFDHGVDGVYIDQIGLSAPPLCHSAGHGHAPGSPAAGVAGYRALIEAIRARAGRGRRALFTESCAEVYLDLFDAVLVLDTSLDKFRDRRGLGDHLQYLPLWPAVYREHALAFGSYATLKGPTPFDPLWVRDAAAMPPGLARDGDGNLWLGLPAGTEVPAGQLTWELGRALTYGNMPMLANFSPEDAASPRFATVLDSVRALREGRDAFLFGSLQPVETGQAPIRVPWLAKWLYCLPGEEVVQERTLPAVTAAAFSHRGRSVTVYANHTDAPAVVRGPSGEPVTIGPLRVALAREAP